MKSCLFPALICFLFISFLGSSLLCLALNSCTIRYVSLLLLLHHYGNRRKSQRLVTFKERTWWRSLWEANDLLVKTWKGKLVNWKICWIGSLWLMLPKELVWTNVWHIHLLLRRFIKLNTSGNVNIIDFMGLVNVVGSSILILFHAGVCIRTAAPLSDNDQNRIYGQIWLTKSKSFL